MGAVTLLLTQQQVTRQGGDVDEIALDRARRVRLMAVRLRETGLALGSTVALREADMISECAKLKNNWIGRDLHRDDGELYDGMGTFAACGSRFCEPCRIASQQRSRRRAQRAVESIKLKDGERWRLVTLTAPMVEGASLFTSIRAFKRAWALLQWRKLWKAQARGGVKSVDWTRGVRDGYHVHIHALVCGRAAGLALRHEWTEAIIKAWGELGHALEINTRDALALVDCNEVSEAELARKVNYLFKAEDFSSLPDSHLIEVAEVNRWQRVFELFGAARMATRSSLDTTDLKLLKPALPKKRTVTLRQQAKISDRETWLRTLRARFAERREKRRAFLEQRFRFATIRALDEEQNTPRAAVFKTASIDFENFTDGFSESDEGRARRPRTLNR